MDPDLGQTALTSARLLRIIEVQREIACADLPSRELYRLVAARAVELTDTDGAAVEEVDGKNFLYAGTAGSLEGFEGERLPIEGTVTGIAARTRTPQLCRDALEDPRTDPAIAARLNVGSYCVVPLLRYGEVAGVLVVVSKRPNAVDESTLETLLMMADLIGAKMAHALTVDALAQRTADHAHARAALQAQADEVAALATARRAVLAGENPRQSVVAAALAVSGAAFVALVEPTEPGMLVATATAGGAAVGMRFPTEPASFMVEVWRSQRARITTDLRAEPLVTRSLLEAMEELTGKRLGGAAFFPLNTADACLGVLATAWEVGPTDAVRLQLLGVLEVLAQEAAIAVEREDLRHRLSLLASTDPLTELANRRRWDEWLSDEMLRARRAGTPLSIALLDLDRFKRYNDTHGHGAGDVHLAACATAWRGQLRGTDLIARHGGEEFVVGLPTCAQQDAVTKLERLRAATPNGQTCSVGMVTWDGEESADAVVARADAALYAAKAAGRDRIVSA